MTQDLQPNTAPIAQNLPDTPMLPGADTPSGEVKPAPSEPTPKPAEHAEVVAGAVLAAVTDRSQALEIAELCQLAGQSTRIASFLAQGISASQVRQALLLSRAQSEEISSLIHPDAANPVARSSSDGASALMAAVKKLSGTA